MSLYLQLLVMSYSLPKGRNYSKQNLTDKKYYAARHSQKTSLFTVLSSVNSFQQKINAKTINRRQSQDILAKRTNTNPALKPLNILQNYQTKYSNLNKKIRDILDNNDEPITTNINKSTMQQSQLVSSFSNNNLNNKQQYSSLSKSTFIQKRTQSLNNNRQREGGNMMTLERKQSTGVLGMNGNNSNCNNSNNQSNNGIMYFLQCLKRKNSITTQFYINIHTSILTFKQFYKLAHQCKPKTLDIAIPPEYPNRKTIVLDMDQTLIHTSEIMTPGYEIKVPFKAFQGKVSNGYVNVRPYAKQLLKKLSKHFDVIIFTAGNKCYADPILDHIDPTGVIQHRLYRQSCTFVANQLFVKDLRILGRNLANVVLVDNAPHSYMLQLANGIPILNYFKGKDDNQLIHLEKYLMSLLDVEDVRIPNAEYFRLHEYMKFDSHDKLITALYGKKLMGNG